MKLIKQDDYLPDLRLLTQGIDTMFENDLEVEYYHTSIYHGIVILNVKYQGKMYVRRIELLELDGKAVVVISSMKTRKGVHTWFGTSDIQFFAYDFLEDILHDIEEESKED